MNYENYLLFKYVSLYFIQQEKKINISSLSLQVQMYCCKAICSTHNQKLFFLVFS